MVAALGTMRLLTTVRCLASCSGKFQMLQAIGDRQQLARGTRIRANEPGIEQHVLRQFNNIDVVVIAPSHGGLETQIQASNERWTGDSAPASSRPAGYCRMKSMLCCGVALSQWS